MRKTLILLIGILILSCNQPKKSNSESKTDKKQTELTKQTENFDWLLGKWKRLNEEKGKETFENWEKLAQPNMLELGLQCKMETLLNKKKLS